MNIRTSNISLVALAVSAGIASSQTTTILSGSTGNADFNAGGGGTAGGSQAYDVTANWFNAQGDETIGFTHSTQMGGSNDPNNATTTRGGMPFQNRTQVNDTGYTIQPGDVGKAFSVSYAFGAGGNADNWDDQETMRTFVFYTIENEGDPGNQLPVDEFTVVSELVELGSYDYAINRAVDGQWTFPTGSEFYTIVGGDVGKTVYFGMQFLDAEEPQDNLLFPRIDNIMLTLAPGTPVITDPTITVVSEPFLMSVESPPGTATSTFRIRNDSEVNSLSVNSFTPPAGSGFSVTVPGALPASVAVGAELEITVQWDSTAASASYETGDLLINTNDPSSPFAPVTVAGGTPTVFSDVLANGSFDTPGTSPGDDTDTFDHWDELDDASNLPTNVLDVPSFAPSSGTACYFLGGNAPGTPGGTIEGSLSTGLTNAVITFDFAFSEPATPNNARKLGFIVDSGGVNFTQLNIRYYNDRFEARGGADTGNSWFTILADADLVGGALNASIDVGGDGDLNTPGDTINYYTAVVTTNGWGTPNPYSTLEIKDSDGVSLGISEPFTYFNGGPPPTGENTRALNIEFNAAFNNHPPSWVDNVVVNGSAFALTPPAPVDFAITVFSINPGTGMGSVTFDSVDGLPYELHASSDLGISDPFPSNVITSGNGTGASTTFNFTDAAAVGQDQRTYRIFTP